MTGAKLSSLSPKASQARSGPETKVGESGHTIRVRMHTVESKVLLRSHMYENCSGIMSADTLLSIVETPTRVYSVIRENYLQVVHIISRASSHPGTAQLTGRSSIVNFMAKITPTTKASRNGGEREWQSHGGGPVR